MTFDEELQLARVRATNEFAMLGLKTLTLANGAAVVSLLTFLGNTSLVPGQQSRIACSLIVFAFGVVLSLSAIVLGYLAVQREAWAPPRVGGDEAKSSFWLRCAAIVVALGALIAFFAGVLIAAFAFITFSPA